MTETSFAAGYAPLSTFRLLALLPLLDAEIESATKQVDMLCKAEEHNRSSNLRVAEALEGLVARTTAELSRQALDAESQERVAHACHTAVAQAQQFRADADDASQSAAHLQVMTDLMAYLTDLMARRTWVRNEVARRGLVPNGVTPVAHVANFAGVEAPAEQPVG